MSSDLTPARLEQLLAAATPGPWRQHLVDETLVVSGSHQIATTNIDAIYDADCGRMAADAALIALSPALAARVIELEAEVERLREVLGDMLDDCEPDRPGAPRLSIREAARAVLNGGDYGA